jgi:outer membrane protein
MKKLVLFILLISSGISLQAQSKKWTLKECVEYALENNISVRQSELDLDLTEVEKSDAIGNFLPSLNGSASNSWNTGLTQNVTSGILENQTNRNSSYSLTVGMNLFQGLRNHKIYQRSELSKLAAQYGLSKMKDDISLFVANAYLQVLNNKANLDVLKSQNDVTVQQIERTNELVDAGVLPRGDLLEIQATDASEKQNIAVTENTVQISLINLAQLLLIQDYENFDIEDEGYEIIDEGITSKEISEIITSAKENRSELKIAQTNFDLAKKDLQISRSGYTPTLSVYMNYNTRESDVPSGSAIALDPDNPVIVGDTPIGVLESTGESVLGLKPNILSVTELGPLPFF